MSSPEVVRFDITEDDYANEFNQRAGFRQSKNQALYGIWADEDSDQEGETNRGKGRGSRKPAKNYKAPLNFVSGGVKVGSAPAAGDKEEPEPEFEITDSEDEAEFREKKEADLEKRKRSDARQSSMKNGFSGGKVTSTGKAVGDWEKHTRGIGQKLLEKMGHVPGRGLGKTLQGISAPVEAQKRSGKAALGFYGNERNNDGGHRGQTGAGGASANLSDYESDGEAEFKAQLGKWKTDGPQDQKKQNKTKYEFRTADDLLSSNKATRYRGNQTRNARRHGNKREDDDADFAGVDEDTREERSRDIRGHRVIDMTGKNEKVLSGYQAIGHKTQMMSTEIFTDQSETSFDLPELVHNLKLLIDITEEDLISSSKKNGHKHDFQVNLKHEHERISEICREEEEKIHRLEEIIELVGELEDNCDGSRDDLKLQNALAFSNRFESDYALEYHQYRLNTIGQSIGTPLIKSALRGWNPLYEPKKNLRLLQQWQPIMNAGEDVEDDSLKHQLPLSSLLWNHWYPCIRSAISVWNTREPGQMCDLLETWLKPRGLIPDWIRKSIVDQLIVTRLNSAVDTWDPLTDTIPIHQWIHPWLNLAGDSLEPLYSPIRLKLARALRNWNPTDPSAKLIIEPWVGVFQADDMNAFLTSHVIPKLADALQKFTINPHNQDLEVWYAVISWHELIARPHILHLLIANFFPKWLHTLSLWLSDQPNYQEITKWYAGWKSVMPNAIAEEKSIKDKFSKALEIMNQALSGKQINTEMSNFYSQAPPPPAQYAARRPPAARTVHVSLSFREMVERRAEQSGLLFMPIPNRTQYAKQVYKLGHAIVYFDNNVVFVKDDASGPNVWIPTSLDQLIDTLV